MFCLILSQVFSLIVELSCIMIFSTFMETCIFCIDNVIYNYIDGRYLSMISMYCMPNDV